MSSHVTGFLAGAIYSVHSDVISKVFQLESEGGTYLNDGIRPPCAEKKYSDNY